MGHADAYDEYKAQNAPDDRAEYERLRQKYEGDTETATSQTGQENAPKKGREEAPEDAFSHYLTLADGRTVRYDVGEDPAAAFPSEWDGVQVVTIRNSVAPR